MQKSHLVRSLIYTLPNYWALIGDAQSLNYVMIMFFGLLAYDFLIIFLDFLLLCFKAKQQKTIIIIIKKD